MFESNDLRELFISQYTTAPAKTFILLVGSTDLNTKVSSWLSKMGADDNLKCYGVESASNTTVVLHIQLENKSNELPHVSIPWQQFVAQY